ncbi:hypothetical protein WA026_001772 [Henosepilachna vigintioctopunctata]|uniref:Transposable element P transposase-like RNase H domain-containing protein n=1 Tax=Henosepilachna vigintioctopunctata TaxID=420089 RepID=A0AAW1USX9_9CUCU
MSIKSNTLYEHIREKDILFPPCKDTLMRYIQKLDSAFGFPQAIFDTLKLKTSRILSVDETALSEGIAINRETLQLKGFEYLGDYTAEHLRHTRADHALVFMFQPFQGKWVQVVGLFLSKDSVTSEILQKLLIECTILFEKAGIFVDGIVSDAAQWNRGVWKLLGI